MARPVTDVGLLSQSLIGFRIWTRKSIRRFGRELRRYRKRNQRRITYVFVEIDKELQQNGRLRRRNSSAWLREFLGFQRGKYGGDIEVLIGKISCKRGAEIWTRSSEEIGIFPVCFELISAQDLGWR
jgi:hypothetical protein